MDLSGIHQSELERRDTELLNKVKWTICSMWQSEFLSNGTNYWPLCDPLVCPMNPCEHKFPPQFKWHGHYLVDRLLYGHASTSFLSANLSGFLQLPPSTLLLLLLLLLHGREREFITNSGESNLNYCLFFSSYRTEEM